MTRKLGLPESLTYTEIHKTDSTSKYVSNKSGCFLQEYRLLLVLARYQPSGIPGMIGFGNLLSGHFASEDVISALTLIDNSLGRLSGCVPQLSLMLGNMTSLAIVSDDSLLFTALLPLAPGLIVGSRIRDCDNSSSYELLHVINRSIGSSLSANMVQHRPESGWENSGCCVDRLWVLFHLWIDGCGELTLWLNAWIGYWIKCEATDMVIT
ncbi:hypothetical protein Tco_0252331 [Tanacetum coccineum]